MCALDEDDPSSRWKALIHKTVIVLAAHFAETAGSNANEGERTDQMVSS